MQHIHFVSADTIKAPFPLQQSATCQLYTGFIAFFIELVFNVHYDTGSQFSSFNWDWYQCCKQQTSYLLKKEFKTQTNFFQ